jgi:hypothetical protein
MFPVKVLIGIGMFAITPNFTGADCPDLDRAKELLRLAEFKEAAARLKVPTRIRRPTPNFSLSDVFEPYTREFSFLLKVTEEGAVEHVVLISRPVGHGMEIGAIRSIHENWLFHPAECENGVKKAMWVPVKMEFYPPR